MQKRIHAIFRGNVQGVGFRFTTVSVAEGFRVTGFVKNLPDGDVEVVAEGDEPELRAFHEALKKSRIYRYVLGEHVDWSDANGQFSGFTIAY